MDRRARAFTGEYLAKARDMDRQYGGVQEEAVGPDQRKLKGVIKGLAFWLLGRLVRMYLYTVQSSH